MLSLHRTIRKIDQTEWNRLCGNNAFATYGWLLTVETCSRTGVEPLYFTLRLDGALAAASVCYIASATTEAETLDDMLFGRLARPFGALGLSFLPAVVCGPLFGYGWHIGVAPELGRAEQDRARLRVLEAIESDARVRGLPLHIVHLLDEERDLQELFGGRGYLCCRNAPLAVLDVRWSSFDEYLAGIPNKRRKEFRRQIRRNREAGNTVKLMESDTGDEARLLELVDINARKHNAYPFAFRDGFFAELAGNLGGQAWMFRARRGGAVTGVCVILVQGDTAYAYVVGVDHQAERNDYTYFQLLFNSVIARAIETGVHRICYGRGMYEVKLRRGCRLAETWIYSKQPGPRRLVSGPWFALASFWNRYKLPPEARRALGAICYPTENPP